MGFSKISVCRQRFKIDNDGKSPLSLKPFGVQTKGDFIMTFEDDFTQFIKGFEYEPHREPIQGTHGNQWKRLIFAGEKKSSARYRLIIDHDRALGIFGSDKDPAGFRTWKSWEHTSQPLNNQYLNESNTWAREKRREIDSRVLRVKKRLMSRLQNYHNKNYQSAVRVETEYTKRKKIKAYGDVLRCKKTKALIVPVYEQGEISSYQTIYDDGKKYFMRGGTTRGGYILLSTGTCDWSQIFICEGYATGCTILEAMDSPVYVTFNANNLKLVADMLRSENKTVRIIIAADNDQFPSENWPIKRPWINTGVTKGKEAAGLVAGYCIYPEFDETDFPFKPTDWNDYACIYGLESVKNHLSRLNPVATQSQSTPSKDTSGSAPSFPEKKQDIKIDSSNWFHFARWQDGDHRAGIFDKKFSLHNAVLALSYQSLWQGTFVYDEFKGDIKIIKPLPWDDSTKFRYREPLEVDFTQLRAFFQTQNINVGSNSEMRQIIEVAASKNTIHPVRNYFNSLRWDGTERLDTWIMDYCNIDYSVGTDYLTAVGKCFLIAAVKRIFNPGEPFHHMLVLEGRQAAKKSSLFRELCTFKGEVYFQDKLTFEDVRNKYLAAHLQGNIMVEFQEMSGFNTFDRNRIKSWITQTEDEIQPKFKNEIIKYPRQFVLGGTTNESSWMNDPTGGRRFWPVAVGDININGIAEIKEQLWAEAVFRAKQGEMHYMNENDPAYLQGQYEQGQRYDSHVWEELIAAYIRHRNFVSIEEILRDCIFKKPEHWKRQDKADIADVLRALGWKNKAHRQNGAIIKKWCRDDNT